MDPFVRKLVVRLFDEGAPLSRNRHFHTFESPEGKSAMRISKRLRSLQQDIIACRAAGAPVKLVRAQRERGQLILEITMSHLKSRRLTTLDEDEFELLCRLPHMDSW
jgi:hypothetical protein